MPKKKKVESTHITLLVDRSGSMAFMQSDAEGGVQTFLDEQAAAKGDCTLYLAQFDSHGYDVLHNGPIADRPRYELQPRGLTPLYDALARAIGETAEAVAESKPKHVFVVVQTDGQENASKEVWLGGLTDTIKEWEGKDWTFIFLAVGPEAFGQAKAFAGTQMSTENTMKGVDSTNIRDAYAFTSHSVMAARTGGQGNYGGTIEDRASGNG